MGSLNEYRKKRNLQGSKEPSEDLPELGYLRFVIHKHDATRLHYDLRLELEGVYKSWAIPKGPSLNPADTRLAIFVEDHPLSYGEFEGVIPKGHYGAGAVILWDRGTYKETNSKDKATSEKALLKGLKKGHLKITLFGEKIRGSFDLVRSQKANQWMLIKKQDAYSSYKTISIDERSVKSGAKIDELDIPTPKPFKKEPTRFHPIPKTKIFKENRSSDTCVFENGPVVSSLTKILWPEDKITKGDLLDYYKNISTLVVKHVHDRPMSLNRYPHGIHQKSFYQKNITEFHPKWFQTVEVSSSRHDISYPLCQNEQSLFYLVNWNCIELHPWLASIQDLEHPDQMVVDIDPSPELPFSYVIDVALAIHELFQKIKLQSYPKTSGGKGLHIYVPILPHHRFENVREFLILFFQKIAEIFPNWITLDKNPNKRKGKIYLDYLQNTRGQTMASAYCVRPKIGAPVSCPLSWKEVSHSLKPQNFHLRNMLSRLEKVGDLWFGMHGKRFDLNPAFKRLNKL